MAVSYSQSNSVDYSIMSAEPEAKLYKSATSTPFTTQSLNASYSSDSEPVKFKRSAKRSMTNSKSNSPSNRIPRAISGRHCKVCEMTLSSSSKTADCAHCRQMCCIQHCLNRWKGMIICDDCFKSIVISEMRGRGEIEDTQWLLTQLETIKSEREQRNDEGKALDAEVLEQKRIVAATRSKHQSELQKIREQFQAEKHRNQSITTMAISLTQTVDESKHCESLTSASTREREAGVEAYKNELYIYIEQRNQLVSRLSALTHQLNGLVSCRQILMTACRSCKTKIKHRYRREILEGNYSENFSTFTQISRSERNRPAISEAQRENCKCSVM